MTGRTFPAFPPRRGAVRGQTWWGRAWTKAMEDTSLDQGRLARGRSYARTGRVGAITVSPGRIAAPVHGTDPEPYQTVVLVERHSDAEWDRFLDEVASRAGHIAALLERDMPHDLVRAAADAGVRLLPTVGDLEPECSCLDWGYPCKHAAALCYQVAWLLDADPFVLLLMRGRGESELLDALQRRAPQPPGIAPADLQLLVQNAAARARELLAGHTAPLTPEQDTVRLAATFPELAGSAPPLAVAAWRQGGLAGLETLETPWTPPRHDLARARVALADEPVEVQEWRNRWTVVGHEIQLRYGRDGRWYPYRRQDGEWWPAGPPDRDPVAVLAAVME